MIEATARPLTANLWTRAFGESLQGFLQTLKARWLSLLVLQIMAGMAGEFFNQAQGVVMQKSEDMLMIFALVGAQFLFLLFWSAAWIALVTTTLPLKQDSIGVLSKNLNQLMIESLRSFSRVILWLPALFIPAIIQYVRLSLETMMVFGDAKKVIEDMGKAIE